MFGWFAKASQSAYIARPPEAALDLVYLHPDRSIPRGTKLTVRANECALFFREGQFIGRIDAGTTLLDTANFPFLGHLLVDSFTGANHFICEIFFVLLNESIVQIPLTPLGQYKDSNSANLVTIVGGLSYTLLIKDPTKLIIGLGGQNQSSGSVISEILNGRMLNWLRRSVGMRTQVQTVLSVVSNVASEEMSQEIQAGSDTEFERLGALIGRVFDLALTLDAASLEVLRQFGVQESSLALQAKGMRLATGDGFAEFNLIQGQRAALEGLGQGLGAGNGPMIISGIGLGGNLTGRTPPPVRSRAPQPGSPVLSDRTMYVVKVGTTETGPFSARQVALMAISKGQRLSDVAIRSSDDSEDTGYAADLEPEIVREYNRRLPASRPATSPSATSFGDVAFDAAFAASVKDGVLTKVEIEMLVTLWATLGLPEADAARSRMISAARSLGVLVEDQ
jgi:hypothetical protein